MPSRSEVCKLPYKLGHKLGPTSWHMTYISSVLHQLGFITLLRTTNSDRASLSELLSELLRNNRLSSTVSIRLLAFNQRVQSHSPTIEVHPHLPEYIYAIFGPLPGSESGGIHGNRHGTSSPRRVSGVRLEAFRLPPRKTAPPSRYYTGLLYMKGPGVLRDAGGEKQKEWLPTHVVEDTEPSERKTPHEGENSRCQLLRTLREGDSTLDGTSSTHQT